MDTDLVQWGSTERPPRRGILDRLCPRGPRVARRYAATLFAAAGAFAIAAEVLPWMRVEVTPAAGSGSARLDPLLDQQLSGHYNYNLGELPAGRGFTYWLTWVALAALAGAMLMAAPRLRRVVGAAAFGVGLAATTNIAGIAADVRHGAGLIRGADVPAGVVSSAGIGLYCGFAAVGLVLVGIAAFSARDWRSGIRGDLTTHTGPARGGTGRSGMADGRVARGGTRRSGMADGGADRGGMADGGADHGRMTDGGAPDHGAAPARRGEPGIPPAAGYDRTDPYGSATRPDQAIDIVVQPTNPFVPPSRRTDRSR